jgi:hypothetical protein
MLYLDQNRHKPNQTGKKSGIFRDQDKDLGALNAIKNKMKSFAGKLKSFLGITIFGSKNAYMYCVTIQQHFYQQGMIVFKYKFTIIGHEKTGSRSGSGFN